MTARLVGWVPAKGRVDVALGDEIRIGATNDNDVVMPVDGVSRAHAKIVKQGEGYCVEDTNSRNGTWVNGERVTSKTLRHLDVITLGRYANVVFVQSKRSVASAAPAGISVRLEWIAGGTTGRRVDLPRGESLVGRASSCQVVIDDLAVSRAHARFIVTGSTVTLEDLGSINGTFVNGQQITAPTPIASDAVIGFGEPRGCRVVIAGTPDLASAAENDYVAAPPPDMEWRTRIVFTADELEDVPVDVRRVPIDATRGTPIPSPPPPPAMTAESARAVGEATQLQAPQTQLVRGPLAQPAFDATASAAEAEDAVPRTVFAPPSLAPPTFGADEATPPTQAGVATRGPGMVPTELAPGGSELPPETVLGFREVGPPPRLLTSASGRGVPPPTPPATMASPPQINTPPPEPRPRRGPIQMVTLTGDSGVFNLPPGTATVGRSSAATIKIDSQDVSRIHAVIEVTGDTVILEDRGSINGTAVNGAAISGRRPLLQGDRVSFADFEFRVDFKRSEETE